MRAREPPSFPHRLYTLLSACALRYIYDFMHFDAARIAARHADLSMLDFTLAFAPLQDIHEVKPYAAAPHCAAFIYYIYIADSASMSPLGSKAHAVDITRFSMATSRRRA